MLESIDLELDDDLQRRIALFGMQAPEKSQHVNERQDGITIRKVMNQAGNIAITGGDGKALIDRVNGPQDPAQVLELRNALQNISDEVTDYQEQLQEIADSGQVPLAFPNLAWESMKLGLEKENFIHKQLNEKIDAIQEKHATISLLLDLNAELTGPNEENGQPSDRAQELIDQLRERGVDIKGENIAELKRGVGSHESKLRSEIQIAFSTEVQRLMQEVESMNQILQSIIRYLDRLLSRINQNSKTH